MTSRLSSFYSFVLWSILDVLKSLYCLFTCSCNFIISNTIDNASKKIHQTQSFFALSIKLRYQFLPHRDSFYKFNSGCTSAPRYPSRTISDLFLFSFMWTRLHPFSRHTNPLRDALLRYRSLHRLLDTFKE